MMKLSKKQKTLLKKIRVMAHKGFLPVVIIGGLLIGLTYKRPAHALSERGKKAVGIIVGAGLMGATAGAAGGAKWVPLGLLGGGLTGGLIARSSTKKNKAEQSSESKKSKRAMKRKQYRNNQ